MVLKNPVMHHESLQRAVRIIISVSGIRVGEVDVIPVQSAKNLGSWFDSHMYMATHITKTCGSAFFYLYNIRHIRKYLTKESTEKLIRAFITSSCKNSNVS